MGTPFAASSVNYVPSFSRNVVQTWLDYDEATVERELTYTQGLGLNCVLTFRVTDV